MFRKGLCGWLVINSSYDGQIAQDIVTAAKGAVNPVTNLRGILEMSDLEGYSRVQTVHCLGLGCSIASCSCAADTEQCTAIQLC
mgnify:CR=1 FL=1